jgi:hypothetical protein
MKKSLIFIAIILCSIVSFSQTYAPVFSSLDASSQMWNTSNVYRNSITTSNLGQQIDTIKSTTASFYISKWVTPSSSSVNNDTFVIAPLYGTGNLTIYGSFLRAGAVVTPTITATVYSSPNGLNCWSSVGTFSTTGASSLTVPAVVSTSFTKNANWYYTKVTSTDTASVQLYYDFKKSFQLQKQP